MEELTAKVNALRSTLSRVEGRRDAAVSRLQSIKDEITELENEEDLLSLVATLIHSLIDEEVSDAVAAVERLLTEGLQAIFEDMDLSVRAEVDVQRGKVSVNLVTVQKQADGTTTEGSSTDAYGGSVATVQSVLMRIIVTQRRDMRPFLLLDESLGAVADHYVPKVGAFLSLLCSNLGMDVLAVTHNPSLVEEADRAYRIRKAEGRATFKEVG